MSRSTNCRAQFTAYLRQHGIKYSTHLGLYVQVNNICFYFRQQSERIDITAGPGVPYIYSIPYCEPSTIIIKAEKFHRCISRFAHGKVFLYKTKSPGKKTSPGDAIYVDSNTDAAKQRRPATADPVCTT